MKTGTKIIEKCYKTSFTNALVSNITTVVTTIVDGVIIGRYLSHDAMSGYGIAVTLVLLFLVLGQLFSKGTRLCLYSASGSGKSQDVLDDIYNTSVWSSLIISAVLSVLLFVFAGDIVEFIGARNVSVGIHEACVDYIKGIAVGAPFMITGLAINCCIILDNDARISYISMVVMVVSDIIGDIIVAKCQWGVFGIAMASSLSYVFALIAIIPHFFRKDCSYHIKLRPIRLGYLREIFRNGAPSSVNSLLSAIGTMVINVMLLKVATADEMAAFSVRSNVSNLLGVYSATMGAVAVNLGGLMQGEDNRRGFLAVARICLLRSAIIGSVYMAVCLAITPLVDSLYGHHDIEELVTTCVWIFVLRIPFQAVLSAYANLSTTLGRRIYSIFLYVFDDLVFPIIISLLLMGEHGARGIWCSVTVCVPLTILYAYIHSCIRNKKISFRLSDWLMIPDSLGVGDDMYVNMEIPLKDESGLDDVKDAVYKLFSEKGDSEEKAQLSRDVIDVYGRKIMEHGMQSQHVHHMSVCAFKKNENYKMILKDDCSAYELLSKAHEEDEKRSDEVRTKAKSLEYRRTIQINELTVVF